MKSATKTALALIIYLVIVCLLTYGTYWCIKTVSYQIFYEDMVKQTVQEMVKAECLKGAHNH